MKFFPSRDDVRNKAQRLSSRAIVLAVFLLACGGIVLNTPSPIKYVGLVLGAIGVLYALALVMITIRHQQVINRETMASLQALSRGQSS